MLLATDQQQSVLNTLDGNGPRSIAYTPYGHRSPENGLLSLIGFNGEPPDALTGHFHLGNGFRQFNPVLMRFNSPDSWSPFGKGGLNAYAYCGGDPRNRTDSTGQSSIFGSFIKGFQNKFLGRKPHKKQPQTPVDTKTPIAQPTALELAPDFDLNNLTSAERKLNMGLMPNRFAKGSATQNKIIQTSHPLSVARAKRPLNLPTETSGDAFPGPLAPGRPGQLGQLGQSSQYENFLNNSLGSANNASIDELLTNHTWLSESAGPSRLAEKQNYTLDKIRKNLDRRLQ
jgi:RHS repeat-associated protein